MLLGLVILLVGGMALYAIYIGVSDGVKAIFNEIELNKKYKDDL